MTYLRFRLLGLIGGWGGELKCLFGVSFSKFLGSGCTDCSALGFAAFVMWPGFYRFQFGSAAIWFGNDFAHPPVPFNKKHWGFCILVSRLFVR